MRKAIRESLEIICAALNRLDEFEQTERDHFRKAQIKNINHLLTRARSYLIEAERKEQN